MAIPFKIGFTGTRRYCTKKQRQRIRDLFLEATSSNVDVELHHGDCVGSDTMAHYFEEALGVRIVLHHHNGNRRGWQGVEGG